MKKNDIAKPYIRAAYKHNRLGILTVILLTVLDGTFSPLMSVMLQEFVDTASGSGHFTILQLLVITLALTAAIALLSLLMREAVSHCLYRMDYQYRDKLFADLSRKNIASFASENTSTYISMLSTDADKVRTDYFDAIPGITSWTVALLSSLVLMLYYSWQLALVSIAFSALPILVSVAMGGIMEKQEKRVSTENGKFVGMVKDLLTGFSVVKSFRAEKETAGLYNKQNGETVRAKFHRYRSSKLIDTFSSISSFVMQFGIILVGAFFATRGWMTPGAVVAYMQLSGMLVTAISRLPAILAERRAARGLITKAAEALADNAEKSCGQNVKTLGSGIECRDLRFGYEAEKDVLQGVNLHFAPGKSYAVVGASGSGKSTILNLLLGGYDTYRGSITVGGTEMREIAPDSLYELLSIIQQNVFVFDATIEENITMFKSFPEAAIQSAIRRSGLEALVAEKGRAYRCGENGCNLSGGERQRISIARCLLKNTQVLLMDEATAALDAQTALNVTNAILDVDGLTRIIVTHKLDEAILKRFDEILVVRGGKIAEHGVYDTLMTDKGYFYALCSVSEG